MNNMPDSSMVETIRQASENPWTLLFFALWALGAFLKHGTNISNNWIPTILVVCGSTLGTLIIEMSVKGFVVGFIVAVLMIGAHAGLNHTLKPKE